MSEDAGQVREEERDPREEAIRLAALSQIRQYPDPVLRMPARDVESFDDDLRRLVDRMKRLMKDAYGVGLAGNQVGMLRRLFVFQKDEDEVAALVNPRIVERGSEAESGEEGCLSIQGIRVPVERALTVTIEAMDENGNEVRLELEGLIARVVQHEIDHLDGTLILDRTDDESRKQALGLLRPQPVLQ
ncbi:MAG: peptide deformylase [Actinobacteria bacterium]|nr:peptide deformylase [Actinomycetota bacterium]